MESKKQNIPQNDVTDNSKMEEKLLFSSVNDLDINQICAILEENNIPFVRRDDGSGAYMNIYMGQSIQEKSIFVSNEFYEKSQELISPFLTDVSPEDEKENSTNPKSSLDKYTLIRRLCGIIFLGLPLLAIILLLIFSR